MENNLNKIILLHWIGRFGNRLFQYAFGCSYAKKYNCIFYIPSEWEGTIIFKENKYCRIITDEILALEINNNSATEEMRKKSINDYNKRSGDNVSFISFDNKYNIGKINVAFDDLHCMYFTHCFDIIDESFIKEIYTFNDNVLNSEIYNWYYNNRSKNNVIHLRRGDIAELNYIGSHSMIMKDSYYKQLQLLNINENIVWLCENKQDRTENIWNDKSHGHKWLYPKGEHEYPNIFFDFFPDYLSMIFAKVLLRGNSSLSWWGAFLSNAVIYSPIIKPKPIENINKYYCMDTEFIRGNYPHFMGSKLESEFFNDIIFMENNKLWINDEKLYYKYKQYYLKYVKFINIKPIKNKKIISFSMYNIVSSFSNERQFYKGIYVNYHLAKTIYPDWVIRIYMPYNECSNFINEITKFEDIELILIDTNICLRALRFLVHDDKDVDIWISRDLDSIINEREKVAVYDWINNYSDKELHIMTDNEYHTWVITCGMFGFKNSNNNSLLEFILKFSNNIINNNDYDIDAQICEKFFYKTNNYIQHYSAGKKLENSKPFPEHVYFDSFVGCIMDIRNYYYKLEIPKHYPKLNNNNKIIINNNDIYYYAPWNTNCIFTWYTDTDFILKPITTDKSTSNENSSLKTIDGNGIKLLNPYTVLPILWDNCSYKDAYISDNNIMVIIDNNHYCFVKQ